MSEQPYANPFEHFTSARPSVHRLYHGAFIQAPFQLGLNTIVFPLLPVGADHLIEYAKDYQGQFFGQPMQAEAEQSFSQSGCTNSPVIAVVCVPPEDNDPAAMELACNRIFTRAEQAISWISGNYPVPFMNFVSKRSGMFARFIPPPQTRRMHLSFGDHATEQQDRVEKLLAAADADERFSFGLSMYRDATHEHNPGYQIARLFSVLESFAYALKGDGIGSRTAVRKMMGLEAGAIGEAGLQCGRKIRYDRVELSGRLRDKLFHGVPFSRDDLSDEWRDGFDLIADHPDILVRDLKSDCETEISKWAHGTSIAKAAADAKRAVS